MDRFYMKPFAAKPDLQICVPGSKSITNRALLLAALAEGKSVLKGVLFSDDSRVFVKALQTVGYEVSVDEKMAEAVICGTGGQIPKEQVSVYVGSAGTAARFLTAMLALSGGRYEVTSSDQMKKRPMRPLLEALEQLGVKFEYKERPYAFPFLILGREERACREVTLTIDESSQFLSALLLSGVLCKEGVIVRLTGKRDARAYVKISMKMMEAFGCRMEQKTEDTYCVLPDQSYQGRVYEVEPDVSAACYFYGMAAVNGGTALVERVHFNSIQGDIRFLYLLEEMGCHIEDTEEGVRLWGPEQGALSGVHIDMGDFSDQVMTLAAVSVFAASPTNICGVGHIRGQESDRLHAVTTELRRLGVACEEREDGLLIKPEKELPPRKEPVIFRTYEDHRMAMALSLIGTREPGIVIDDPLCCRKTYEGYFEVLTNLGLRLQ